MTETKRTNLGNACELHKTELVDDIIKLSVNNAKCAAEKTTGEKLNEGKSFDQLKTAGDWAGLVKLHTYCHKAGSVANIIHACEAAALTHPHIQSGNTPQAAWESTGISQDSGAIAVKISSEIFHL